MYGRGYGQLGYFHYPNHVEYSLFYPSYGGYGYCYSSYNSMSYIYPPVYRETEVYIAPAYDVPDDSELDEAVDEILESLPDGEEFEDSIGAEAVGAAERAVSDDIALRRLLIELDELPEDLLTQPEADSDESSDAQQAAADPQSVP